MDARKEILTRGSERAEVSGGAPQISENELKAAEFGMVVHIQREGHVEDISRKELLLLHGLGEAPSHGAERDVAPPVRRGILVRRPPMPSVAESTDASG